MGAYYRGYHRIFRTPFSDRADMNPQSPVGCLMIIIVPLLLLCSTYMAWWELRFLIQGRTTDATVDGVDEIRIRNRLFGGSYMEVRYSFQDEETNRHRSERDELPLPWPRPAQTVRVQYVPGLSAGSRLDGHRHVYFTIFFVLCVTGSLVYGFLLLRDAGKAVREEEDFESKRRRRHET